MSYPQQELALWVTVLDNPFRLLSYVGIEQTGRQVGDFWQTSEGKAED